MNFWSRLPYSPPPLDTLATEAATSHRAAPPLHRPVESRIFIPPLSATLPRGIMAVLFHWGQPSALMLLTRHQLLATARLWSFLITPSGRHSAEGAKPLPLAREV